jgi:hypothetical protein
MTTPRKSSARRSIGGARSPRTTLRSAQDLQPQATGANRGSPAAPVMKQFAKTGPESGGKA